MFLTPFKKKECQYTYIPLYLYFLLSPPPPNVCSIDPHFSIVKLSNGNKVLNGNFHVASEVLAEAPDLKIMGRIT